MTRLHTILLCCGSLVLGTTLSAAISPQLEQQKMYDINHAISKELPKLEKPKQLTSNDGNVLMELLTQLKIYLPHANSKDLKTADLSNLKTFDQVVSDRLANLSSADIKPSQVKQLRSLRSSFSKKLNKLTLNSKEWMASKKGETVAIKSTTTFEGKSFTDVHTNNQQSNSSKVFRAEPANKSLREVNESKASKAIKSISW